MKNLLSQQFLQACRGSPRRVRLEFCVKDEVGYVHQEGRICSSGESQMRR
jgi:hypothetical protein